MGRIIHPSFAVPTGYTRLWRYMNTAKFIDLIQTQELWFSRSDLLGDPYEGSVTELISKQEDEALAGNKEARKSATEQRKLAVKTMHINCWHMNERESAAMWSLYAPEHEAVAITTDFWSLGDCLPDFVYLGIVKYVDYSKDKFEIGNLFNPFMHKRSSFEHEKELRALLWDSADFTRKNGQEVDLNTEPFASVQPLIREFGAAVPVDLNKLIKQVYVSPASPSWYTRVISRVCEGAGLTVPVHQSNLLNPALF